MKILRQVEIVVVLMPIFFAQSILAFGQYDMKSSEDSGLSVSQFKCQFFRSIYAIFWSV